MTPTQPPRATLGDNIRRARLAAGIQTQSEFARRLGTPQPRVSDWENNRHASLDLRTVLKVAATIGCSIDDLLDGLDRDYDESRARADARLKHKSGKREDQRNAARLQQLEEENVRLRAYQQVALEVRSLLEQAIDALALLPRGKGGAPGRSTASNGERH